MSGLDHFEFIRQIGKGSYGEVTLQRHKRDRKQYVLKRINLKKASKREQHSAEQEAKLLSKLKHPNIVTYKDSFQKDGFLHIAMQFCEGGDLYTKLKEQKGMALEERQVVEWFVQIAMALQYMHERNILHRDLKTQNIFLTKSKIIKVGDLGIARVLESSSDMATTLIGTPYYMSPELFSNKPYNHKSDVWALGCCVYEMATLKHAFNAKDMNSLVYKILRGRMPPMPKQYSQDLLQLIKNMLHQEPDKRPSVNRILRDSYIKKNISIFLEETKKSRPSSGSRPSSASRQRPSTAPSRKPASNYNGPSSSRDSAGAKPPRIHLPGHDQAETEKDNVSIDNIDGAPAQAPAPAPAIIRKPTHARKPSDGKKPDLAPIQEDKPVESPKNLGSSSSSDSQDTVKAKTAQEQNKSSSPPRKNGLSPKKKKNVLKKHAKDSDTDSIASVDSVSSVSSSASARSKKESIFRNIYTPRSSQYSPRTNQDFLSSASTTESDTYGSEQPKPVDNPRPLPPPPRANESEGLPERRRGIEEKGGDNSKSSSTSSSKEENASWDVETPREPNLSARQRRREKNPAASSYERPNSARIHLKPTRRHESQKITKAEKSEMLSARSDMSTPRSARMVRISRSEVDLMSPRSEYVSSRYEYDSSHRESYDPWDPYGPVKSRSNPKKVRQPSLVDTSSSEEETLKENEDFKMEKEKHRLSPSDAKLTTYRENKEMNNFISLLDTTLKMNKDDDKSDEEAAPQSPPSHPKGGGDYQPTELEIHRSASLPSVETLCNADRLTSRIQILHVDCVRGVGYEILHKAFEILSNIEDDELEPQLIELMGKEKFDQYAGKIWQLKFCNECFEQLPHLRS